jgi:hypothetical protein
LNGIALAEPRHHFAAVLVVMRLIGARVAHFGFCIYVQRLSPQTRDFHQFMADVTAILRFNYVNRGRMVVGKAATAL